ncbi:hypothetical protein [Phyllobacterium sp. P5_D12]
MTIWNFATATSWMCGVHGRPTYAGMAFRADNHMAEEIPELLTRELAAFHERHQ